MNSNLSAKPSWKLRIAGFSFADDGGGAAKAAYRLHTAFQQEGHTSKLYVLRKQSSDSTVIDTGTHARFGKLGLACELSPRIDLLPQKAIYPNTDTFWSPGWYGAVDVTNLPGVREADVIILYWVTRGLLGIRQIGKLLEMGKPVIWRLSDMWPFTGGCHYSQECDHYIRNCGACPQLDSKRSSDLSSWLHTYKRRHWMKGSLTIACPSHWMAEKAQQSALFSNRPVKIVPTGVDCDRFLPLPKSFARTVLQLPLDKPLILYGATSAISDPRKGGDLIARAYNEVFQTNEQKPELVIYGSSSRPPQIPVTVPVHSLGVIRDEKLLPLVYSACDLFVAPSREENLANSVLEAMACGLPILAMNVGGMPDAVSDGINGRLINPKNPETLAIALNELVSDQQIRRRMADISRQIALNKFSLIRQTQSYIRLMREMLR